MQNTISYSNSCAKNFIYKTGALYIQYIQETMCILFIIICLLSSKIKIYVKYYADICIAYFNSNYRTTKKCISFTIMNFFYV